MLLAKILLEPLKGKVSETTGAKTKPLKPLHSPKRNGWLTWKIHPNRETVSEGDPLPTKEQRCDMMTVGRLWRCALFLQEKRSIYVHICTEI